MGNGFLLYFVLGEPGLEVAGVSYLSPLGKDTALEV